MRLNESTVLVGSDILLVPYRKEHVEKYHVWMQDPDIQAATASEPLTIEQEYEMQSSWHIDDDKLTFIILERNGTTAATVKDRDLSKSMVGDVNLFLSDAGETEALEDAEQGELEIMIAEKDARRKGYASQALALMIRYAMQKLHLGPEDFLVRIGMDNASSIRMFQRLGFEIVKTVEVFREVELRIRKRTEHFRWLMEADKELETFKLEP
ncbi:N-acetyltransferase 9 [Cystobasidium minutum MCA 4210]|uniref:N-acetyltransferase 9 n=1 Tax=Cystobasidium minutum MCA 4210 TaxID=1397322 RepID=UPI0034CE79E4|eukprot:jgi/Rhomi1/156588/estExt_Genewise1Plus.C_1_t10220